MKKLLRILIPGIMVLTMIFFQSGCTKSQTEIKNSPRVASATSQPYPVLVSGVVIPSIPEKIVSLSPPLTELICALEGFERLAGVSAYCAYPAKIGTLPRCGSEKTPDINRILEITPQYVLTTIPLPEAKSAKLRDAGITILVFPAVSTLSGLIERYEDLGAFLSGNLSGREKARARAEDLTVQVQSFFQKRQDAESVKICYVTSEKYGVATGDSFSGLLLEKAGGENVAASGKNGKLNLEALKASRPDVILCEKGLLSQIYKADVFADSPAVKNKKVFELDASVFERQDDRMIDCLHILSNIMYGNK